MSIYQSSTRGVAFSSFSVISLEFVHNVHSSLSYCINEGCTTSSWNSLFIDSNQASTSQFVELLN
jgi:hypothetical protein